MARIGTKQTVGKRPSGVAPPIWNAGFSGTFFVLTFKPTSLWSLRSSETTSSGGKSLVCPSPYSIKLALVDALIQSSGIQDGVSLFDVLRGRPLRVGPPSEAAVTGSLLKLRKRERSDGSGESPTREFQPTMGYREYVHFAGSDMNSVLRIAIGATGLDSGHRALLASAARALSYSGKRGGFWRFLPAETADGIGESELPLNCAYSIPVSQTGEGFVLGTFQTLDELSSVAEWPRVSTYSEEKLRVVREKEWDGKADRVYVLSLIPYRIVSSSRACTHYRRTDATPYPGS